MKVAKLYDVNDLRIEELPDPNPADDEVVIQVKACGVCATDVNMWRGTSSEGDGMEDLETQVLCREYTIVIPTLEKNSTCVSVIILQEGCSFFQ